MTINKAAQTTARLLTASPTAQQPKATSSLPSWNSQTDTVQIDISVKAALQEATESPEQTEMEAGRGDPQAQLLLAKEEASTKAFEAHPAEPYIRQHIRESHRFMKWDQQGSNL